MLGAQTPGLHNDGLFGSMRARRPARTGGRLLEYDRAQLGAQEQAVTRDGSPLRGRRWFGGWVLVGRRAYQLTGVSS